MHVCIVGTGASGWIACNYLKHLDIIDKITIIGSSKIPSIGVGESTTLLIQNFINDLVKKENLSVGDFVRETDAAIKYGVMYKGWSEKDFIHYFKDGSEFSQFDELYTLSFYGRMLANKDKETHIHEIMGTDLFNEVRKNNVLADQTMYKNAYHFDAAMFIKFFSKVALKSNKVNFIDDVVLGGNKNDDRVTSLTLTSGEVEADFYIFATGDHKINEDFLNVEYEDLSNILLTNKAIAYPLKYTNKKNEFHPYTVAKTMKNGWRWITPTWSRIGTGYVFSDKYISVEDAIKEFKHDIGDESIEPFTVDFSPRMNREQIHENWCTIGMASGFLEPLDAPGLHHTISSLMNQISYYLEYLTYAKSFESKEKNIAEIEKLNDRINAHVDFWITFILTQYKTSNRSDTEFWKDHKNVSWSVYDKHMQNLDEQNTFFEKMMLRQTIASRDIQWNTSIKSKPYKTNSTKYTAINHLDFIQMIHNQ